MAQGDNSGQAALALGQLSRHWHTGLRSHWSKLAALTCSVVLALGLSACESRVDISINSNDTYNMSAVLGVSKQQRPDANCAYIKKQLALANAGSDVIVEDQSTDTQYRCKIVFTKALPVYTSKEPAIVIRHEANSYRVRLPAGLMPESALDQDTKMTWTVTFPGPVLDASKSNGGVVNANKVVWTDPKILSRGFEVTGSDGKASSAIWNTAWLIAGALLLAWALSTSILGSRITVMHSWASKQGEQLVLHLERWWDGLDPARAVRINRWIVWGQDWVRSVRRALRPRPRRRKKLSRDRQRTVAAFSHSVDNVGVGVASGAQPDNIVEDATPTGSEHAADIDLIGEGRGPDLPVSESRRSRFGRRSVREATGQTSGGLMNGRSVRSNPDVVACGISASNDRDSRGSDATSNVCASAESTNINAHMAASTDTNTDSDSAYQRFLRAHAALDSLESMYRSDPKSISNNPDSTRSDESYEDSWVRAAASTIGPTSMSAEPKLAQHQSQEITDSPATTTTDPRKHIYESDFDTILERPTPGVPLISGHRQEDGTPAKVVRPRIPTTADLYRPIRGTRLKDQKSGQSRSTVWRLRRRLKDD